MEVFMFSQKIKIVFALYCISILSGCSLCFGAQPGPLPVEDSLATLAYDGRTAGIKAKIAQCPSALNVLDDRGFTPLQEAVRQGHVSTVDLLCKERNIDVNAYSKEGLTALHYAIERKQCAGADPLHCNACKVIRRLLDCPTLQVDQPKRFCARILTYLPYIPFFSVPDAEGITALHIAAGRGDIKSVTLLIEKYKEKHADIHTLTYWGRSPLHYAALYRDKPEVAVEIIKLLCKNGALVNQEDHFGFTPLHMAVSNSQADTTIAKTLVEHGAAIDNTGPQKTPLMMAVEQANAAMVDFLLNQGASADVRSPAYGFTALDLAIDSGSTDIQKRLLACNAPYTMSHKRLESMEHKPDLILYPLHEAAASGNLKRIEMIMKPANHFSGYYTDADSSLCLPLHHAACNGYDATVAYLLEKTLDINTCDKDNKTPLLYAVEKGHAQVVRRILEKEHKGYLGSSTTIPGVSVGSQLLEIAAEKKHVDIVLTLVQHGANTPDEHTFLWAIAHDFQTTVEYLLGKEDLGELFEQRDVKGKTALDIALENNNEEISCLLIRKGILSTLSRQEQENIIERICFTGLKQKICDWIDIENIVSKHAQPNKYDAQADPIDLQSKELRGLSLMGLIQPSLQHPSKALSDQYSVYYALFNATRTENQYCLARTSFSSFFRAALTWAKHHNITPPYNELKSDEIEQLIKGIKAAPEYFSVDRDVNLDNIVIVPFDSINLDHGIASSSVKNYEILNKFIEKSLSQVTFIINSKRRPGSWLTIIARHEQGGNRISFRIFDSELALTEWKDDLLYHICCSNIIPLGYMFSSSRAQSQDKSAYENEIIEYVLLFKQSPESKIEGLLEAFGNFTKYLEKLYDSIDKIKLGATVCGPCIQEIINTIRFAGLAKAHESLAARLLAYQKEMKDDLRTACGSFMTDHAFSIAQLQEQFSFVVHTSGQTEKKIQLAGEMLKSIPKVIEDVIALKSKFEQQPDSLLKTENFYDAQNGSISGDELELIKKHLQSEVRTFVQDLTNGTVSGVETLLFYGDPGNGKTTIAQAIAQLCTYKVADGKPKARPFHIIRVPALGTEYQFSKQKQLAALNTYIKENPYAVILLDEIDALSTSEHALDSAVEVCNQLIDYAIANKTHNIFIGTTNTDINTRFKTDTQDHRNKPLAPALLSRFINKIKIENPTLEHRRAIIEHCLALLKDADSSTYINLTQPEQEALAQNTQGFSIRDIKTVFKLARQYTFADSNSGQTCRQLTNRHIATAVEAIKKGKRIEYMHIVMQGLKNFAIHGPAWLNVAHAVYSDYIHGLQRNADTLRGEEHRLEDRVYDVSKLHDQLERDYYLRVEGQARHEFERAEDRYVQETHRDTDWRWQVVHTAISIIGLLKR
jgi:ankyrin repeat protein/DNA replication protein DnaC